MKAFESISPHSPGDNRIGTNNKHSMRLLRGLKRQQWYEDRLLPVLRETCFRHQRLEHCPSPQRMRRSHLGKRKQALGQLP